MRAITTIDLTARRKLAADLFNHTWTLLVKPDRTAAEDDEMIHGAHASRYHWGEPGVGQPVNLARGEWQCSRVYTVLGQAEPALWHARRWVAINEPNGSGDFDLATAYEAMARAYLVAGDAELVAILIAKASALLDRIDDAEDRELLESDLAALL